MGNYLLNWSSTHWMHIRNFSARRLWVSSQLGEWRQRWGIGRGSAPLKSESERLQLVHEDDVVELDEVAAFFAVNNGRSRCRPCWSWRRWKLLRLRILFARFFRLGCFNGSLRMEQNRTVNVAGGLRLVPVVLHDVGEVDVLTHDLKRHCIFVNNILGHGFQVQMPIL